MTAHLPNCPAWRLRVTLLLLAALLPSVSLALTGSHASNFRTHSREVSSWASKQANRRAPGGNQDKVSRRTPADLFGNPHHRQRPRILSAQHPSDADVSSSPRIQPEPKGRKLDGAISSSKLQPVFLSLRGATSEEEAASSTAFSRDSSPTPPKNASFVTCPTLSGCPELASCHVPPGSYAGSALGGQPGNPGNAGSQAGQLQGCCNVWAPDTTSAGADESTGACFWQCRAVVLRRTLAERYPPWTGDGAAWEECSAQTSSAALGDDPLHVVALRDVFVTWTGEFFNASHRFLLSHGTDTPSAAHTEFSFDKGSLVTEVQSAASLALPGTPLSHRLLELVHRLPLYAQLSGLMPGLKEWHFLLGTADARDHMALRHLLGISPWHHLLRPLPSLEHRSLVFVRELILPILPPGSDRQLSLWAALRSSFFLPPDRLPIFQPDWSLAHPLASPSGGVTEFPTDWIVLVAKPPASLDVDPTALHVVGDEGVNLQYPYVHLEQLRWRLLAAPQCW